MKRVNELLFVSAASTIVGCVIGLPIILLTQSPLLTNILKSALVGLLVGLISWIAFAYFYRNSQTNKTRAFFAIVCTIGAGTLIGAFILGVRQVLYFLILIGAAELVGLILGHIIYKRARQYNENLKKIQHRLNLHRHG